MNDDPTPTEPYLAKSFSEMEKSKAGFNKLYVFIPVTFVLIFGTLLAFFVFQSSNNKDSKDDTQEQLEMVTPKKNIYNIAEKELAGLKTLKTTFYKPTSDIHSVIVTDSSYIDNIELMTYGIGTKSDSILGRVSVTQFAKPESFSPPENCGPYLPGGLRTDEVLGCREVEKNEKYTGFAYEGLTPGLDYVGEAGESVSKLTLYAEIDNTVIVIQGIGVSADSIINYMSSMSPISFEDYPADTTVLINKTD